VATAGTAPRNAAGNAKGSIQREGPSLESTLIIRAAERSSDKVVFGVRGNLPSSSHIP